MAETLMKKLYNRNKELEAFHKIQQSGGIVPTQPKHGEASQEYKNELEKELEEKQKMIEKL